MEEYSVAAHVGLLNPVHRHIMQITLIPFDLHATLLISLFLFIKRLLPQIYKFPQSSLAELARNSVIQSGFEMEVKRHWLGQHWYLPGDAGNEINRVSLPCRLGIRSFPLPPFVIPLSVFWVYSDR